MKIKITESYISMVTDNFIANNKLACFDIDGTIIKPKSGRVFPRDNSDWKLLYYNTKSKLQKKSEKYSIIFFSNQKGLKKKDNVNGWIHKIKNIIRDLDIQVHVYASLEDDMYRKPSIGLWDLFIKEYNIKNIYHKSFYCSDAAGRVKVGNYKKDFSDSDRKFALNIKLKFYTPEQYFLKKFPRKYKLEGLSTKDLLKTMENKAFSINEIKSNRQTIIIMVGYPGSGKSVISNKIKNELDYKIISQDECKTSKKCISLYKKLVKTNQSIIIDNTNPTVENRKQYLDNNLYKICLNMITSMEISMHNNKYRNYISNNKKKRVPKMVYYMYRKKYVKPTIKEGFDKIINVNISLENVDNKYFMYY
jgi:bifunctional polynucleotide phosphatase/kinase